MELLIVGVVIFIVIILIMRVFGAWMLRINEVIDQQKETNKLLERLCKANGEPQVWKDATIREIKVNLTEKEIQDKKLGIVYSPSETDNYQIKIENVKEGSSCDLQGIKIGDIITKLNGVKISKRADLDLKIQELKRFKVNQYEFIVKRK